MGLGFWYWLFLVLSIFINGFLGYRTTPEGRFGFWGSSLILVLLLILLGIKVFGSPVQGG